MAGHLRRRDHRYVANDTLDALGADLRRVRARCRRFKREADIAATTAAWEKWSQEVGRLDELFTRMAKTPVTTLPDIAVRYQALAWELLDGDLIVERGARRRVAAFARDLYQFARSSRDKNA